MKGIYINLNTSKEVLKEMAIHSKYTAVREKAAELGLMDHYFEGWSNIMYCESDELVRLAYLKRMIKIKNWPVVKDMAEYEKSGIVKEEIARNGFYLNLLIHDENPKVRAAVVSTGFGLKELAKSDDSFEVKQAIIRYGYPEKRYFDDSDDISVIMTLAECGFITDEAAFKYGTAIRITVAEKTNHPEKFAKDGSPRVRAIVATRGCCHDILVRDECTIVRGAVAMASNDNNILELLANDMSYNIRAEVAKKYPERFLTDSSEYVRAAAASSPKASDECLDLLVNDRSAIVRREIAKRGKYLDILVQDEDDDVRAEVARCGHNLDTLATDESVLVRKTVAETGYDPNAMLNDEDSAVRHAAKEAIIKGFIEMLENLNL